jgi:transposase
MTIEMLLADRGYDTDEIINYCKENGIDAVIPPKKNRVVQREFDEYIYKIRHLVENAFLKLKQWRGIATRYAKTTTAFVGAVTVRCLFLWLRVIA